MKNAAQIFINPSLIAPCGMNCALCYAYQRNQDTCPGCRYGAKSDSAYCQKCIIRHCGAVRSSASGFCYECERFPCARLRRLDTRYRLRYGMSMIENLSQIKAVGMEAFLKAQIKKWSCPECGGLICVHRGFCLKCTAASSARKQR
jgi:hypothetical protein